jgi:hypothetical protein
MCMRWTRAGSSCGSRGWRAAGAFVKGVGIAFEFVLTAAAGLANDLAERLLIAIFGCVFPALVCGYWGGGCVQCFGSRREQKVELLCKLIVTYPTHLDRGCSCYGPIAMAAIPTYTLMAFCRCVNSAILPGHRATRAKL